MANKLALKEKNICDSVQNQVTALAEQGNLVLPKNYSPENAMKSAWLILQETKDKTGKKALDVCTKDSIANTLLNMAIQGLSPAKKQCYFIVYGTQLQLTPSYFGSMAVVKRLSEVQSIDYQVIYEEDVIEIQIINGVKTISKHDQDFMNIDPDKIKGAYCIITRVDGSHYTEIMNMNQIYAAWAQSKQNPFDGDWKKNGTKSYFEIKKPYVLKPTTVHAKFTDQMVLKTVINRACKTFVNTSDDSDLLIESYNQSVANEFVNDNEVVQEIEEAPTPTKVIEVISTEVEPTQETTAPPAEAVQQEIDPGF